MTRPHSPAVPALFAMLILVGSAILYLGNQDDEVASTANPIPAHQLTVKPDGAPALPASGRYSDYPASQSDRVFPPPTPPAAEQEPGPAPATAHRELPVVAANPLQGIDDSDSGLDATGAPLPEVVQQIRGLERNQALVALTALQNQATGENRQFVLKQLSGYADLGGNGVLVQAFLETAYTDSAVERGRILSYVQTDHPLADDSVTALAAAYEQEPDAHLRRSLASTLSRGGGRAGVDWVAQRLADTTDVDEWSMLVSSLGNSASPAASDYLHQTLNRLVEQDPGDSERKQRLREAILTLNKDLKD